MRPAAVEDEPTPRCCGQVKKGRGALSYGFPTRECRLLGRSPKLSLLFLARRLLLQLLHTYTHIPTESFFLVPLLFGEILLPGVA